MTPMTPFHERYRWARHRHRLLLVGAWLCAANAATSIIAIVYMTHASIFNVGALAWAVVYLVLSCRRGMEYRDLRVEYERVFQDSWGESHTLYGWEAPVVRWTIVDEKPWTGDLVDEG